LEKQSFLLVPTSCCSPSPDSEEEQEVFKPMKTQYSCYEYLQIKMNNGSNLSQKVALLFTMRIGLDDFLFPFFVDRGPLASLPKQNKIKIN
jgi:hypothetical protein